MIPSISSGSGPGLGFFSPRPWRARVRVGGVSFLSEHPRLPPSSVIDHLSRKCLEQVPDYSFPSWLSLGMRSLKLTPFACVGVGR